MAELHVAGVGGYGGPPPGGERAGARLEANGLGGALVQRYRERADPGVSANPPCPCPWSADTARRASLRMRGTPPPATASGSKLGPSSGRAGAWARAGRRPRSGLEPAALV